MSANPSRKANGVLPNNNSTGETSTKKQKPPVTGKKVTIRRLAPAMTADEFWSILGEEWKFGGDRVSWARFQSGKVSTKPGRSTGSFCNLYINRTEDLSLLSETVRSRTWEDAKGTYNHPCLIDVPCVEIAAYQKVPMGKSRVDPRQGTIDQDPEYMAFLEDQTKPQTSTKETEGEQAVDDDDKENTKSTTTALVEYIKEKKAAKAKEAANAKSAKHARQESQGAKAKASEEPKKKGRESKSEKADKAAEKEKEKPQEPIKLLTKKAATREAVEIAKSIAGPTAASKSSEEPKGRRAGIAAAAKILQRDLGLSPGSAHRRARQDAAKAEKAEASNTETSNAPDKDKGKEAKESETPKTAPTGPKAQTGEGSRRSRGRKTATSDAAKGKATEAPAKPTVGPIVLLKKEPSKVEEPKPKEVASPATKSSGPSQSATAPAPPTGPKAATGKMQATSANKTASLKKGAVAPTPGATRAFIKHANPSQGVTEPLLKQAMETFGTVTFVEIDKRKGFAYVDFGDHQALSKAIAASPVTVAQGTVQVLERKDKKSVTAAPTTAAISSDKASGDASATTSSDRAKRGGRARGRRSGGNSGAANGGANNEGAASSTPPQAPAAG